jgi:hypothetical protein
MSNKKPSRTIWSWLFGPIPNPLDRFPPEPSEPTPLATREPMTREQQTKLIVGAIFGAVLLYVAYDSITNPNMDGLNDYQRCSYWAYWHMHGGSVDKCQQAEAEAAATRMRVAAGYSADPQIADEQMKAEAAADAALANMQPTDPSKKY